MVVLNFLKTIYFGLQTTNKTNIISFKINNVKI